MNTKKCVPRDHRVTFDKVLSPKFDLEVSIDIVLPGEVVSVGTNSILDLKSHDMDIKEIINDMILKDILAEEEKKFTETCESVSDNETYDFEVDNDSF